MVFLPMEERISGSLFVLVGKVVGNLRQHGLQHSMLNARSVEEAKQLIIMMKMKQTDVETEEITFL